MKVTAPKKYGNPYFDAMECPVEVLPETFTAKYRTFDNQVKEIDLPTKDCFQEGNFVARRYAGITRPLVELALLYRGIVFRSTVWDEETGIQILEPKY